MLESYLSKNGKLVNCPRCKSDHPVGNITCYSVTEGGFYSWSICQVIGGRINFYKPLIVHRGKHEEVERLAHAIWESEGKPDGRAQEHWQMAEEACTVIWELPTHKEIASLASAGVVNVVLDRPRDVLMKHVDEAIWRQVTDVGK